MAYADQRTTDGAERWRARKIDARLATIEDDIDSGAIGGGGGGGGAPTGAAYVTIGNNATLTAERALTAGAGVTITDAGANSTVTISAPAWPIGSVFISVVSTNPATLLGYGTWSAIAAGRVLVGLDAGDADFDTAEEVGGAKTVASAGSVAAPTISGSTAAEAAHTHSVTSNVTVADHASHTHAPGTLAASAHAGAAVAAHADHTHTYTQIPNHVHVQQAQGGTTASTTGTHLMTSAATGGSLRSSGQSTLNPTGGVATATTAGASASLTHTVTQPSDHTLSGATAGPSATLSHTPTNNAVTSGAGSSHSHTAGTLAASAPAFTGSATSVVQPYFVVYMWKRTA